MNAPLDQAMTFDRKPASSALPFDAAVLDRLMDEAGIDVLLISSKHNIQYLFGGYRFLLSEDFGPREEAAARELGKLVRTYNKPILLQSIYARHDIPALRILREEGIPYYESIEITCRAMAALSEIGLFRQRQT